MKKRILFSTVASLFWLGCLSWISPVQGQTITVVAGSTDGNSGNGGQATSAQLSAPQDVVVDTEGNFYITDFNNHNVRRVDAQTGNISGVAGTGTAGFSGIPGPANAAAINQPQGITMDGQGNYYFSTRKDSSAVLKVEAATGNISIVAGGNTEASNGDGGAATDAAIFHPWGVEVAGDSVLYINDGMAKIRQVNLATGVITTIAGNGTGGYSGDNGPATNAMIDSMATIAVDGQGNIYLAEANNKVIRKIDVNGVITTYAGTQGNNTPGGDGAQASAATFNTPWDIEYDPIANSLYVSDSGAGTIRKIDLSTNIITEVANTLSQPKGMGIDAVGDIYVAEVGTSQVKKIAFPKATEITVLGKGIEIISGADTASLADGTDVGKVDIGESVSAVFTIRNDGNATLNISNVTSTSGKFVISGLTFSTAIPAGKSATFLATYSPTATIPASDNITITSDDADEATYTFAMQGNAGSIENALDFDGTDDFVKTRAYIKGSYTKEAWVYFKGADQLNNIVSGNKTTANTAFWVPNNNGLKLAAGHNGKWFMVQDTAVFPVNKWVHVAVTYDEAKNTMTLYKNGVQVSQNKNISKTQNYNTEGDTLLIGSYTDDFFFNGMMDEVRIWDYARTAGDINGNINNELAGSETGLLAYYSFNQGDSAGDNTGQTSLYDRTANGNNGILQNFTLTGATSNWVASTALSSDVTAPSGYTVAIDQVVLSTDNTMAASFTFAGAEVGAIYSYEFRDTANVVVSGTGTINSATDQVAGIDLSGLSDGDITLSVTLTDAAGNVGLKAADVVFKDTTGPAVVLSSTESGITNQSPIPLTVTFNEPVKGFAPEDLTVDNGSAGNLQTQDSTIFTVDITPADNGTVTVDLPEGAVTDSLGLPNTAAVQFTIMYDTLAPVVTITTQADSLLSQDTFIITITFNVAVSGFEASDIQVTNGQASNLKTSDNMTFTADIKVAAKGAVIVAVPSGVASSQAGNLNIGAKALTRVYLGTSPSVIITSDAGNTTSTAPIPVTITFSDKVSGFAAGDITLENGSISSLTTTDSTIFKAEVMPDSVGAVKIAIAAGVAKDAVGNNNQASDILNINFITTIPLTVALSTAESDPTSNSPFMVTITFSEVVKGFAAGDITIENGSVSSLSTSDSVKFQAEITPAANGKVNISVAEGVAQSEAGEYNQASDMLNINFIATPLTVSLSTSESDPTSNSPFVVTITFSEAVTGFEATDIAVNNGTAGNLQTADNVIFTVDITPAADGAVTVAIAADVAQNADGIGNTAAETLTIVYQEAVTGIDDLFVKQIGVYPIPASQYLKVDGHLRKAGTVSIVLANSNGQVVKQKALGKVDSVQETLSLTGIPDGVYVFTIYVDGVRMSRKIIINK